MTDNLNEDIEQDPIIYTPLVPTKAKFEVLDPCGCVTETHEFEFKAAYWAGRGVLTMGGYQWMVTGSGKYIQRIGAEPLEENPSWAVTIKPNFWQKLHKWMWTPLFKK